MGTALNISSPLAPRLAVTSAAVASRKDDLSTLDAARDQNARAAELLKDKVEIGLVTKNDAAPSRLSLFKNLGKTLLPIAAGVGILAALPASLPLLSALTAGASATGSFWVGLELAPELKKDSARLLGKQVDEAHPALSVAHTSEKMEGVKLDLKPTDTATKATREMIRANMKVFPTSRHVLHVAGHGFGDRYSGGQSSSDLAETASEVKRVTGKNLPTLFVESCYSGNLELASRMAGSVDTMVAFEDMSPSSNHPMGKVPLDQVLFAAASESESNAIASAIAKRSGEHISIGIPGVPDSQTSPFGPADRLNLVSAGVLLNGLDSTVVAYDLQKLKSDLHPALGSLGENLSRLAEEKPGFRDVLKASRQAAEIDNKNDLLDLGTFVSKLQESQSLDPVSQEMAEKTQKALSETILEKRTSASFPLSGMSFHTKSAKTDSLFGEFSRKMSKPGEGSAMPEGWQNFVRAELKE